MPAGCGARDGIGMAYFRFQLCSHVSMNTLPGCILLFITQSSGRDMIESDPASVALHPRVLPDLGLPIRQTVEAGRVDGFSAVGVYGVFHAEASPKRVQHERRI